MTPLGPARVAYQRMAPPRYDVPQAVSVVLDTRRPDLDYAGTVFPADQIAPYSPELATLHPIDPRD